MHTRRKAKSFQGKLERIPPLYVTYTHQKTRDNTALHLTHQNKAKNTPQVYSKLYQFYIGSVELPAGDRVKRIDTMMWNRVPQHFLRPNVNPDLQRENEIIQIGDLSFESDVVSLIPKRPCNTP